MSKWLSGNCKWEFINIDKDDSLSTVTVKDRKAKKDYDIIIEHIRVGDKFLDGTIATENENHIVADKIIPNYIKNKALELITC